MESKKINKDNKHKQKKQFNFLTKKTPIASQGVVKDKEESVLNFLKKTDDKL